MSSEHTDPRVELRAQLLAGSNSIPLQSFQRWDVERVRAFKKAVQASRKMAGNQRATEGELRAQINQLSSFWS